MSEFARGGFPARGTRAKCDWLVVAMHATEGSRNAEFGMIS